MIFDSKQLDGFLTCLMGHIPLSVLQALSKINLYFPSVHSSKAPINTRWRLAHFLGQCAHESNHFHQVYENLNYSKEDLNRLFSKYFPDTPMLATYAQNPKKIASRIYATLMGNGDELSQDGYRFRGRGYIQLTGKSNYGDFTTFVGHNCISNPDLVATTYPLLSAAFFFHKKGIWPVCDTGCGSDVTERISRMINGGSHGLVKRNQHFQDFLDLLLLCQDH
jgi:putative chitinase